MEFGVILRFRSAIAWRNFAILVFCTAASAVLADDEAGFVSLFNGKDLSGWVVDEGTALVVTDGCLTGNPKAPGIIRTEKKFEDFELRLEFWIDRGETHEANGGVFFRMGEGDPHTKGYESQISLQDGNNPSGSIYGYVPQSLELIKPIAPEKQWNRVRIRCVGPRVQVWYNDEQLQDCTLEKFKSGHIGLQHHHNGCTVKYRNIRIKPLTSADAEPGWQPLFNAKNLDGWTPRGATKWKIEEGELVGEGGLGTLYYTAREYADFEIRAMVKISAKANSGLLFRSRWPAEAPDGVAVGYECQIDNWDSKNTTAIKNVTGSIYGRFPAPLLTRDDAWFSLRVMAVGDHIQSWVNGRKVTDFHDASYKTGYLGLQGFAPGMAVRFRDILAREAK